jgi:hypothetical protein
MVRLLRALFRGGVDVLTTLNSLQPGVRMGDCNCHLVQMDERYNAS